MVDLHESSGCKEVMGEHEIVIDCFREIEQADRFGHKYEYVGWNPDIKITMSTDGVYPILTAFID